MRKFGLVLIAALIFEVSSQAGKKPAETHYVPVVSSYEKMPLAVKGGTLYSDLASNPKVMNPILADDTNSWVPIGYLYASLFTEDDDTLSPLPYLAETYTISADRMAYTFTLCKDARWEDGTAVTSDDVRFTFDTMMDPKTQAASLRSYWEGTTVEVLDSTHFRFHVREPKFDTLRTLYLFQVIQKKQFEGEADFNRSRGILNPVGNGPYKLKAFSRDQKVELDRIKDWWGYRYPHFKNLFNQDVVVLRIIEDPNLKYEHFIKSDIDLMDFNAEIYKLKVLGTDHEKFGKTAGDGKPIWAAEFKNQAPRGFSYLGMNLTRPIFASKKTRQALAMLVDYQQVIDKVFYGFSYQSTSPFGSLSLNSDPELRKPGKTFAFDPKKALALLKEDGWADTDGDGVLDKVIDGKKTDFRFTLKVNSNNPLRVKIAQIVQSSFKAAGIDVQISSIEWNSLLADMDKRDFDMTVLGWSASPYPNPRQMFHSDSIANQGSNYVAYSNPKVDQLIGKANLEFDLKKRAKILREINRILYDDQAYIFLVEPRSLLEGFSQRLKSPAWVLRYSVLAPKEIYQVK